MLGSTSSVWSFLSATADVPALARTFTSTAATLERIRPSSASFRANREISESYSSHSGIARARASLGSFCQNVQASEFTGVEETYSQGVLAEIYGLGTVKPIFATYKANNGHIYFLHGRTTPRLHHVSHWRGTIRLTGLIKNIYLAHTQSQSSCKEYYDTRYPDEMWRI